MSDTPVLKRLLIVRDPRLPFVDLDFTDPETREPLGEVCLTGANGCGKSTLLARLHEALSGKPRWLEPGDGFTLAKFQLDEEICYVARPLGGGESHLFRESIESSEAWPSLAESPPVFDELPRVFGNSLILGSAPPLAAAKSHWFDGSQVLSGDDLDGSLETFLESLLEERREAFHRFLRSPENRDRTVAEVEEAFESTSPHSLPGLREAWGRVLAPAGFRIDFGYDSGPFFDHENQPVVPARFGDALRRTVLHLGVAATRPSDVLFLDLPESGLHPEISSELIGLYRSLFAGDESRPLLVVATHCPLVASSFAPTHRLRLERDGADLRLSRGRPDSGQGIEEILRTDFGLVEAESPAPAAPAPKEDHPSRIKRAIRRSENEDELADLIDEVMTIGKPGEPGR